MKRYLVTFMCCLTNFIFYCTRHNLNIAIIEMVRRENATEQSPDEPNYYNSTNIQKYSNIPTFDWDEMTQQSVLGAFYYGYTIMPIPGAWLAGKIGGKPMIGLALIWTSLLTALIPLAARVGAGLVITLRILDGFGQGTSSAACYVTLAKWTVPNERSTMVSIAISGMTMGVIVSSYISAWICSAYEFGGWPMSFYTYSIFGIVLVILWMILIYETPNEDPFISNMEIEYLNRYVDEEIKNDTSIPWRAIFTSSAVWGLVVSDTTFDFGWFVILTETPIFLATVLGCDLQTTGMLTSIPSIVRFPIVLLAAICADHIIRSGYLSVLNTRKLFVIIDLGGSAACFFVLSFAGYSLAASVVLITLAFGALGFNTSSINTNPMDISPKYAGIIAGIMQTVSNCSGFIVPTIIGLLTEHDNTFKQWSLLFLLTAGIQLFGMVIFLIFAKGEEQDWSKSEAIHSEETTNLVN